MGHAVSWLQALHNTPPSPWTAFLVPSVGHLPLLPNFLIFQVPAQSLPPLQSPLPSPTSLPLTSWWNLLSLPWSLGTTHPSQRFASPLPFQKSEWCRSCNSHSLCLQLSASKSGRQRRAPPGFLQHNP